MLYKAWLNLYMQNSWAVNYRQQEILKMQRFLKINKSKTECMSSRNRDTTANKKILERYDIPTKAFLSGSYWSLAKDDWEDIAQKIRATLKPKKKNPLLSCAIIICPRSHMANWWRKNIMKNLKFLEYSSYSQTNWCKCSNRNFIEQLQY